MDAFEKKYFAFLFNYLIHVILLRVHFIVFHNNINDTKISAVENYLYPFDRQLLIVPFWLRKKIYMYENIFG